MRAFLTNRRVLKWAAASLLGLIAVLVLALALFDWNALRGPVARLISAKVGHPTSIDGKLSAHIWSWNPIFTVEDLNIRNPPWTERKLLLTVQKVTVQISLGHLLRGNLLFPRVEIFSPDIDLERDKGGRANWDPESSPAKPVNGSPHLPAVRRLVIQDGKIHLDDRIRKLSLKGTVVADEQANNKNDSAFQLRLTGSLNSKPLKLQGNGGPLINVDPHRPYTFAMEAKASDIALDVQGSIPKPFDLSGYDAKFVLTGDDLADAYYLTNLALPNTAKYRLAGNLTHRGDRFEIDDFHGTVGASDLSGKMAVVVKNNRPRMTAELTSNQLNMADLAAPLGTKLPAKGSTIAASSASGTAAPAESAAARAAPSGTAATAEPTLLLPDANLQVNRVRGMDADVNFKAQSVTSQKVPVKHLIFHLMLDNGVLRLDPLSFTLPQGQFAGSVRINAVPAVPETDIDMKLENIDLAQFKPASAKDPPLEGMMAGRIKLHGRGESVHKFASSADGSVSVVIPHGEIRAVLAELTGINVARGVGLLLAKDQQQTELRCGVVAFQSDQGHMNAKTIVMDTTDVLITGGGHIDLQNEQLDLSLQGKPKKLRFVRLRSPISLEGTLSKPKVGIKPEKTILQAGAGTLLGLLTPVAAILAFVDPGLAKNANCSELLSQATPGGSGASGR